MLEKGVQKGRHLSCRNCFFGRPFRDPAPNRRKAAPDPQNHRFVIKILARSDAETDLSEFSLFSSQHLWRTWGPQDGAKFRTLRSFLFLAKIMGRAMLVHLRIFLGVRRCHAARRLQYIYIYIYILDLHRRLTAPVKSYKAQFEEVKRL